MRKAYTLIYITFVFIAVGLHTGEAKAQNSNHVGITWGASLEGSVDMSGNDMSNIGMEAYVGMHTVGVQMLGIGSGIYTPVSNSQRTIPLYAIVRTNFSSSPSLCFGDIRGGLAINFLEGDHTQADAYVSAGIGMNLASGRKYSSHLIIGYTLIGRGDYYNGLENIHLGDLHMVTARLGITF